MYVALRFFLHAIAAGWIVFIVYRICTSNFFEKFRGLSEADAMVLAFVPFAIIYGYLYSILNKHGRLKREEFYVVVIGFLFLVFILGTIILNFVGERVPASIILASIFATLGWVVTWYSNTKSMRKSHTMNVLLQMRSSPLFNDHLQNIFAYVPYGQKLSAEVLEREKERRAKREPLEDGNKFYLLESLTYTANYYEFICAAIEQDDLDDKLIRNSLRSILSNYHRMNEPFIEDARKSDMGLANKKIYEHFTNVVKRYDRGK